MTDPLFGLRREPAILGPGAVHVPDWMSREQQEFLLRACLGWAAERPPRQIVLPGGGKMSVRTLSLGRHWTPYRYDDEVVPPLPAWLVRAARSGLEAAAAVDPRVTGRPGHGPAQKSWNTHCGSLLNARVRIVARLVLFGRSVARVRVQPKWETLDEMSARRSDTIAEW